VDQAGGMPRGQPAPQVARLRGLRLVCGEEGDELEELEGSTHHAVEARLA
jgi:hypothetical protein